MQELTATIHEHFVDLSPVVQAGLAGMFTWGVTALGAGTVFMVKTVDRRLLDGMLGFAGGVMLAASYWSLLAPAIDLSLADGGNGYGPAVVGFLLGGLFLYLADKVIPHLHIHAPTSEAEGVSTGWTKAILLVMAITLHNIPEGLAVGVGFGGAAIGAPGATIGAAIALAIGIGLQNFPEGVAVAMPLRREGLSRGKAFWYGQLSGIVEPIAAVAGCYFVVVARPVLPYALAFAAGAMVYVVVEEVVPETRQGPYGDMATLALMLGFALMMSLDVGLG